MSNLAIFNNFKPINLKRNPFLREGEYALWDANLHHNDLRPFACPQVICEGSTATTLYPLPDCCCAGFDNCSDPVKGFCHNQHFYIQEGRLYQAETEDLCGDLGEGCLAGAPKPKPPIVPNPECSTDACDAVTYHYVMTYTTSHAGVQVESTPSEPFFGVVANGHRPNVVVTWEEPPAGYCIVAINLYRTESEFEDGTTNMPIEGAEFLYVGTVPVGGATFFIDSLPTEETGYPLVTGHPETHPAPEGIKYLARTEDGIVVADDCRVYISRPGEPMFAYDGIVSIDDEILGLEAIGNTIFVFTDNYPVRIQYKHSEGVMTIDRVTVRRRLPLKSRASIAAYGERIYFAAEHGLYAWDIAGYGADIRLVSQELFTPEQWRMIDPDSLVGTAYEFGYLLFSHGLGHGLMLEFGRDGTDTPNLSSVMPISARLLTNGRTDKLVDKGLRIEAMAVTYDGHFVYRICDEVYGWDWRRDVCRREIHEPNKGRDCCPWTARLYYDSEGKNEFSAARWEFDERTGSGIQMAFNEGYFGHHITLDEFEVVESRAFGICGYSSAQTHWIEAQSCVVAHEFRMATSYSELVSRANRNVAGA